MRPGGGRRPGQATRGGVGVGGWLCHGGGVRSLNLENSPWDDLRRSQSGAQHWRLLRSFLEAVQVAGRRRAIPLHPHRQCAVAEAAPTGMADLRDGPKAPSTMGTLQVGVIPTAECPEVAYRQKAPPTYARRTGWQAPCSPSAMLRLLHGHVCRVRTSDTWTAAWR